ncbi:FeoA family protein [Colwellia sp. MEBiC06753]
MTLWELIKGEKALISHLCNQIDNSISIRLVEMGFIPEQTVTCLRHSPFSGPVVIQIGDCVYSLEQQVAEKIYLSNK